MTSLDINEDIGDSKPLTIVTIELSNYIWQSYTIVGDVLSTRST